MKAVSVILPLLWFLFASAVLGCNHIEREALLNFKDGLIDPSDRLASWAANDAECCRWFGVVCDNSTAHVTELHLRILSSEEFSSSAAGVGYYFYDVYFDMTSFGGKLSESLLDLKHLNYLDLSNNNFEGVEIPKFLGSMESLRYLNLSNAGFGGTIPHQLGNLTTLQYLNLKQEVSLNVDSLHWLSSLRSLEFLDLSGTNLSRAVNWLDELNTMPSLVELHLSACVFDDSIPLLPNVNFSSLAILDLSNNYYPQVPSWVFRLPTLSSLDLSGNSFDGSLPIRFQNITTLTELYLSRCNLNSSIFNLLHGFTHLQVLHLDSNYQLQGLIPSAIGNLTSLGSLDLSGCSLEGEIPSDIGNLTSLKFLDLSQNRFSGGIPSAISDLDSLTSLDMSDNDLEGEIPTEFRNLCNLRSLKLSKTKLSQDINEVFEILSECGSDKLESLILPSTQLSGQLSDDLLKFKNLAYLDLNDNLIAGTIPENLGELNSLIKLDLGKNKLNGTVSVGFGMLAKLADVDISDNSLAGEISELHFANLTNLVSFVASGNRLILRVSPDWFPPFQLISTIKMGSWQVGPDFPTWIQSLKYLAYLDFSNSKISSTLPVWFNDFSSRLYQYTLSHNQMHGSIPYLTIDDSDYSLIDLSSNFFEGPMPSIFSNPFGLDLSNNSFSGSITTFLCNKSRTIDVLNLGENMFSGDISDCWMNWGYVSVIRLSNNKFRGNIPESIGTLSSLQILNLRNNNLSGAIPVSLENCTRINVFDLSENEMSGEIPTWIGQQLQHTSILNLRGNKFHGLIPKEICNMANLQILDFAENKLNGTIPKCINNLTAMISGTSGLDDGTISSAYGPTLTYKESSSIVRNGRIFEYSTILNFVRSLDLSNNKLSGEIPDEITTLVSLQALNLSHNFLKGRIPKDIGAMKGIESLDFSQNQLSGEIPPSMSSLTFLSNLNLSYNKLSGRIPSSTQLRGLDSSSFRGNENLCGPPLTQNCSGDDHAKPDNIEKEATEDDWNEPEGAVDWSYFYISVAPGFVIGFWGVIGPLLFKKRWRHSYFIFLNELGNRISRSVR
ncbi:receptor-like protein EIX2 [Mercurialis annua]|uniref:receptor-like protein EIX2 n=1 Tax=Mercurialis annua TaxID=3986 RepID=UPI00215F76CF|nr:receptor-like protein EIX2 [Mercurialis annua]